MKVRPPFIYALILALSILSIVHMVQDSNQVESVEKDDIPTIEHIAYTSNELYSAISPLIVSNHIDLLSYHNDENCIFRFKGEKHQLKNLLKEIEKIFPKAILKIDLNVDNKVTIMELTFKSR